MCQSEIERSWAFPEYPVIDLRETGKRILQLWVRKGLRVEDEAEYMASSMPQAIYKRQRGDCLPSLDNLYALSRFFRASM